MIFQDYHFIDYLISIVLAFIMLGLGMSLTPSNFKFVFLKPKSLVLALIVQIVLIPVIALAIGEISFMKAEWKMGLVIVSVCASGAASNLITYLFKGNVALAITMTTFNSLLSLLTIPVFVNLALLYFFRRTTTIELPVAETVLNIFIITVLPAVAGVIIRKYLEKTALNIEKYLKYILPVLLFIVFTIKIFAGENSGGTGITLMESLHIFPFALLLNGLAQYSGFIIARKAKVPFCDQYTIGIEVGLHNTALALLIAGSILKNSEMQKPIIVYAAFSFFTAILFAWLVRKYYPREETCS